MPSHNLPLYPGNWDGLNDLLVEALVEHKPQTMVLLGDSITAACFNATAAGSSDAYGYWTWAHILLQHRFQLLGFFSTGGLRTDQIITQYLPTAAALSPGYCVVQAGTNDCSQIDGVAKDSNNIVISATSIQNNLNTMYTTMAARGSTVIATTINPNTGISTTLKKQTIHDVNQWIRNKARTTPGMILCDWYTVMVNPTSGDPAAALVTDSVHPNHLGAFAMGQKLAASLAPLTTPVELFPYSNADARKICGNPMMTGNTAGLATGGVTLTTAVAAAVTATTTKVTRTDGVQGEWQQIYATVANDSWSLNQAVNSNIGTDWAIGDLVYGVAEVEIEPGGTFSPSTAAVPLKLNLNFNGASGTTWLIDNRSQGSYGAFSGYYPTGRLALRTITAAIPASTTGLALQVQSGLLNCAFRVGRMEIFKANSAQTGGI